MKKRYLFILMLLLIGVVLFLNVKEDSTNININNTIHCKYNVDEKLKDGLVENVGFFDYGNISIKLEKLKISEINVELVMSFKSQNSISLNYGCAIFDNKGNIYLYNPSTLDNRNTDISKEIMSFCKKHNIKYDYTWGNLKSAESRDEDFSIISKENNIVTTKLASYSEVGFGNSNNPNMKMDCKMGDICYIEIWNLNNEIPFVIELDLPTDFYTNSQVEFKQITKTKNVKVDKAVCDDTSFLLVAEISDFYDTMKKFFTTDDGKTDIEKLSEWYDSEMDEYIYITDENENVYYTMKLKSSSYIPTDKLDRVTFIFDINTSKVTSKLFIHVKIDNKIEIIELQKNK